MTLRLHTFLLLLALAQPSLAGEEAFHDPRRAAHLSGLSGLTGTGSMVDGEIPSPLFGEPADALAGYSARFLLRYGYALRRHELEQNRHAVGRVRRQEHRAIALHGITVHGLDLALGLPYAWDLTRRSARARSSDPDGVGNLLVAAKVGLRVPNFILGKWAVAGVGFYGVGRVATGAEAVEDPSRVEAGMALIGPFGHSLRYHGNFALLQDALGHSSFVFRIGGSAVPLANEALTFRFYGHLAGREHEGSEDLDLDFEIGGQLLLFGVFTIDLDLSIRLLDGGHVDPRFARDAGPGFDGVQHEGSFALTFGVGVVL